MSDDLYPQEMRQQVEAAESGGEPESDADRHESHKAQMQAYEMAIARDDLRANDLAGRRIGPWTVAGHRKNAQGRNVYVLKHWRGHYKGVKGHALNAMFQEARSAGVL